MLIIDGDYPMAHGGVSFERDLTLPIEETRMEPILPHRHSDWDTSRSGTMASIPEMRKAEIAVALVKISDNCILRPGNDHGAFNTDHHSYSNGMSQLAYYQILETLGHSKLLKTSKEFKKHMSIWENATDYGDLPVGMVLGMEGADPIVCPEQLHEWFEQGLRVISLSHYGVSRYSHGTGTGLDGGLLEPGKGLLTEMEKLGIILDVSHTSDESVKQELDMWNGPVLASHQNCRSICPGERQFPDHQIKRIIERGAVIGHSMDTHMLWPNGIDWQNIPKKAPFQKTDVTLENFVDHIDHVCQLAGNSLHSAIGGDTDGQGGARHAPLEVDTVADYQKVANVMADRGYSTVDFENVMWRNWNRFFEENLTG